MALPTLNVTPGSGATINTLPNAPAATANSVSVALATDQAPVAVTVASLPLPTGAMPAAGGSVALAAGANIVGGVNVADPTSGHSANVFQFHSADNVALGGSAYGINTGGVAQLLNAAGNLDRQREAGVDGVPAIGIASGAASFAMQFKTASIAAIAVGTQSVTPNTMSGSVGGVPWSIQVGSALLVDVGGTREVVVVSATTASSFTASFSRAHATTPVLISGFVYNQGRDAAGENDGASGSGTAIAAEYEFNAGDPSGGNFDRARSLNAKGFTTQAISAGGSASSVSLSLTGSAGLQPGMKTLLYKSATFPAAGSFESVNVDLGYVAGSGTVPLASPIVNSIGYDTIAYDGFSALGPQLNGFLPFGVGIEEEALYDPVSGKYYVERAATQDGMPPQNIVVESLGMWNGTGMDRATGATARGLDVNVKNAAPIPVAPVAAISIANRSGYINGGVASAAVTALSTAGGFTIGDALTMPAASYVTTPAVLAITNIQAIPAAPAVASSGTGGGTGAVTLTGTDGTGTKFVCTGTMTAGALSGVSAPSTVGNYTVAPANANSTSGAGCAVTVTGAGAGSATGVQLYVKFTPVVGALTVTAAGVYAPASAANIASIQAATAPASTSGSGSLAGLTVTLQAFAPLSTAVTAVNAARQYLAFRNESASQTLSASLSGTAAPGTPGTTTVAANGGGYEWAGDRLPSNALTLIGQAAFQLFTAWEG